MPPAPETGRAQLNRQLVEGAANLAGPAADLASGAGAVKTATNYLKSAALDKLLGPTALFAGSMYGVLRTVRSIVRESGILEKGLQRIASVQGIQGKFETLMKSATAAKARIEELYRFTARSPFDFGDVAEASRLLQSLTKGAYAGTKAMETVGDMAAATGSSMAAAAEKTGKLYAALSSGRSLDKVLFQLQMSGVVTDDLAQKLESLESSGASFSSKWQEVEKVLGATSGGMKNEIENLDALRTRLDNANAAMAQAFGEPYVEAQVKAMKAMIAATENLTPLVAQIGKDFSLVPNFIRETKNELLNTVAASRGFADALKIAYNVAVSLFAGLGGAVLVTAARNLFAFGGAALETANSLRTAYAATMTATEAQTALTLATELSTMASKEFAGGNLASAAALKAESVWLSTKTRALALNTAAARAAGAGTSAYSMATHAANVATGLFAGGVALARKGLGLLVGAVRGSVVAFATNPWAAGAALIVTVAAALYKWSEAAKAAAADARDLADSIAETTKQLDAQAAAVRSLSDWQKNIESLRQSYADLTDKVLAFNREVENGKDPSREEKQANAKNVAAWQQTRAALVKEQRRPLRNLDLSDAEKDRIRQEVADARAVKDRTQRLAVSSADTPEQRLAAMEARRAELESRISEGRAAKAGEVAAMRNGSAGFLSSLELKRADLTAKYDQKEQTIIDQRDRQAAKAGAGTPEARDIVNEAEKELRSLRLARKVALDTVETDIRNIGLTSSSPTVRTQAQLDEAVRTNAGPGEVERLTRALEDAKAAVAGLADAENELAELTAQTSQETRDLGRLRATQNMENEFDARINKARKAGKPTGGIAFDKALALAEVKRNDAKSPEEAQAAQNEIDAMLAEREAGRREVDQNRRRNAARIGGDRKGAQAIDDAAAMAAQVDKYAALGLSAEQAKADFAQSLMADAAGRTPSIVADSLQAVGGGGGAFQGGDPMLAAQERATRAAEQAAKDAALARQYLADIRESLRGDE